MSKTRFELDRFQAAHGARYRKFLVVVDDTPESAVAIRFACGRALHSIGGRVMLFHAIPPGEFQHWMGVADVMAEEAREAVEDMMRRTAEDVYHHVGLNSEVVICEGEAETALMDVLSSDPDVFALILGAHAADDPGPLVKFFCGPNAGALPCPVVIVPGGMALDRIDAIV